MVIPDYFFVFVFFGPQFFQVSPSLVCIVSAQLLAASCAAAVCEDQERVKPGQV